MKVGNSALGIPILVWVSTGAGIMVPTHPQKCLNLKSAWFPNCLKIVNLLWKVLENDFMGLKNKFYINLTCLCVSCSVTCVMKPGKSFWNTYICVLTESVFVQARLHCLPWKFTCLERPQNFRVVLYRFHHNSFTSLLDLRQSCTKSSMCVVVRVTTRSGKGMVTLQWQFVATTSADLLSMGPWGNKPQSSTWIAASEPQWCIPGNTWFPCELL